ncbi:TPA: polysaccharide pyruvyl transferase family protein [Proteus mirabilis]|uniref:Polysaccharide pyruvyl transferase domain-containing protein n=1 Tax=Proteus mirabilis TaxID=584 RepID=A0A385JP20_PROMI|nr:polysaccharide pyruvyl transferase family protein [Proteus sp. G2675]AXZ00100.1 hypothetical protein [Proteus mirabilis]NBL94922.1 polysaccharide pyruvyl transferase family protein [Proteus sp. G2675]HEK0649270.1 polysaccharide pyruvyl transferase family protein [Proteus mirabilis]HEK2693008.1 polysaccharide pyruvyl transferase family protein [Proteus mirabilis]
MKNIDISVGILTMHRVINYGSFLQAYATQEIIKSLGFNCEIIDYMFPNKWHYDNGLHNYKNIKSIISDYIYRLGMLKSHRKRKEINIAINKYLNLSYNYKTPDDITKNPPIYDIYITGSDQTWNTKHTRGDTTFLLSFAPKNVKKISFSASIAGNCLDEKYKKDFKKYLSQYNRIAIRDSNGNKVINEINNSYAEVTLDPTLVFNRDQWSQFARNKKQIFIKSNYIIFYLITHSFDPRPYIYELLYFLQQKTGLKVYSFTKIPKEFNINYEDCSDLSVEHFIQLFENSSYVVTSSFHGTAFATNFGIPLYSVIDDINNQDDRQTSLLSKLEINNCLVSVGTKFEEIDPTYDIEREQKKLNELRSQSINFLKENLIL